MTEESKDGLRERVAAVIEDIRPKLQADGGDVELVGVEGGTVKVRLKGACHGCPMAAMTLQMGIQRILQAKVPEVEAVENVVD